MATDAASFADAPVLILAALAALGLTSAFIRDAAVLSFVYMVVGSVLSSVESIFVGKQYAVHTDVYRPFSGFTPRYMLLHPLLLGCLCAAAWATLRPLFCIDVVEGGLGPGVKISAAIAVCGSLPVYTLGFASHRTPAAVVVAWQVHTAAQLLAGGVVLDAMG